jgi:ATP/maltotriose-dependent transcriptional regulator MalT/DNA-binding SARP family transcriptional activator
MVRGRLAKLVMPVSAHVLSRSRLFEQMDQACHHPLVWIGAAAGAGKSTLAASYVQACGRPALWYRLDEGDKDPATLFWYLDKALKQHLPKKKIELPKLDASMPVELTAFARRFFRALFSALKADSLLVFDDFQQADDELFHQIMRIACEELPPGCNIIVTSRQGLPRQFALLQSRQQVMQLTWDDLRFTDQEVRQLVDERTHGGCSQQVLQRLCRQSEGWISALILLLGHGDGVLTLESVEQSEAQQPIFQLFETEILDQADESFRRFLLICAQIPTLSAELAAKISERKDAGALLQQLVDRGLFTFVHPGEEALFSFHPLFREFLQQEAEQELGSQTVRQLQRQIAGRIFKEQPEEAIRLWSQCGEWEDAIRLILEQAKALAAVGRTRTLEDWLRALPESLLEENPWLLYRLAQCRFVVDIREAERLYRKAFSRFTQEGDAAGSYLSWAGVADCINFAFDDFNPLAAWLDLYDELRQRFPRYTSLEVMAKANSSHLLTTMQVRPSAPKIRRVIRMANFFFHVLPIASSRIAIGGSLGNYYGMGGHADKLASVARHLDLIIDRENSPPFFRLLGRMALAFNGWMNQPQDYLQHVEEGLRIANESGIHQLDMQLFSHGVYGSLIEQNIARAQHYLERQHERLDEHRRMDMAHYHYQMGWSKMLQGELEEAIVSLSASLQYSIAIGLPISRCTPSNLLCQIHTELGDLTEAENYLQQAEESAEATGGVMMPYMTDLSRAWLALRQDRLEQAGELLEDAFTGARKNRISTTTGWWPKMMGRLCQFALSRDIHVDYVVQLIRSNNIPCPAIPSMEARWPWPARIYTLGRFGLQIDDKNIDTDGRAQRRSLELLKTIIAMGGEQIPSTRLIAALWPDAEADAAFHSLESTLHRLRKLLGKEQVEMKNGLVSLNQESCWVDVLAFGHFCKSQPSGPQTGTSGAMTNQSLQALGLYRGAFLPGDESPWALTAREQHNRQAVQLIKALADHYTEAEDLPTAVALLERGLELAPLSEPLYRHLIECLLKQQEYAEAKLVYLRCEHALRNELDLPPSPATRELLEQMPGSLASAEA